MLEQILVGSTGGAERLKEIADMEEGINRALVGSLFAAVGIAIGLEATGVTDFTDFI